MPTAIHISDTIPLSYVILLPILQSYVSLAKQYCDRHNQHSIICTLIISKLAIADIQYSNSINRQTMMAL